jgi:hypothetical protein
MGMKRFLLLSLVVLIFVTANAAWSTQPAVENGSWTVAEKSAEKPSLVGTIREEFQKDFREVRSAIETYVHTVVTVATALIKAVFTVVTAVVKLVVRFALAVMVIVVRWLLSLFLPV